MKQVSDIEFIQFIVDHRTEHGYPPSVSEMVERFGLARSTIQWHLERMEREGMIVRVAGGARALKILPPGLGLIATGKQITSPLEQL